jgi:hypothetical protein
MSIRNAKNIEDQPTDGLSKPDDVTTINGRHTSAVDSHEFLARPDQYSVTILQAAEFIYNRLAYHSVYPDAIKIVKPLQAVTVFATRG